MFLQVSLNSHPTVASVWVTMSPGAFQKFAIFVVEILDGMIGVIRTWCYVWCGRDPSDNMRKIKSWALTVFYIRAQCFFSQGTQRSTSRVLSSRAGSQSSWPSSTATMGAVSLASLSISGFETINLSLWHLSSPFKAIVLNSKNL